MRDPYLIQPAGHAAAMMAAFESAGEILTQRELIRRTGPSRGTLLESPLEVGDGSVVAPEHPGFGVEFRPEALAELEYDPERVCTWKHQVQVRSGPEGREGK